MKALSQYPTLFPPDAKSALRAILAVRFSLVGAHSDQQREGLINELALIASGKDKIVCRLNLGVINLSEWRLLGDGLFTRCVEEGGLLLLDCQGCSSAQAETFNYLMDRGQPGVNPKLQIVAVCNWDNLEDLFYHLSEAFCDRFWQRIPLSPETLFTLPSWQAATVSGPVAAEIDLKFSGLMTCRGLLLGTKNSQPGRLQQLQDQKTFGHVRLKNVDQHNPETMALLKALFLPGRFPGLELSVAPMDSAFWAEKTRHHTRGIISEEQAMELPSRWIVGNENVHLLFGLPKSVAVADEKIPLWTQTPAGYLKQFAEYPLPVPLLITESLTLGAWRQLLSDEQPLTIYVQADVPIPSPFSSGFAPIERLEKSALPLDLPAVVIMENPVSEASLRAQFPGARIIHVSSEYNLNTLICSYDEEKMPIKRVFYEALKSETPIIFLGLGQNLDLAGQLRFLSSLPCLVDINGEIEKVCAKNVWIILTPEEGSASVFSLFPRRPLVLPAAASLSEVELKTVNDFQAGLAANPLVFCHGNTAEESVRLHLQNLSADQVHFKTSIILNPQVAFSSIAQEFMAWGRENDSGNAYRLLVIQQAHSVAPNFFDFFKSMLQPDPEVLLPSGDILKLQPYHKVIFSGKLRPGFFERYCYPVLCTSFSIEQLQAFINPCLADCKDLLPKEQAMLTGILWDTHDYLQALKINAGLTRSDVAAIFSKIIFYRSQQPELPLWQVFRRALLTCIVNSIENHAKKAAYCHWLQQRLPIAGPVPEDKSFTAFYEKLMTSKGFIHTKDIRALSYIYWETIRETEYWQEKNRTPPGKIGLAVCGPTCSGKDHLLNLILNQAGKKFLRTNAGTDLPVILTALDKSIAEGNIFIVSELDLLPKSWVNSMILHIERRRPKPGFRLISTINGSSYASRQAFSRELLQIYPHRGSLRKYLNVSLKPSLADELMKVHEYLTSAFPLNPPSERLWLNIVEQVTAGVEVGAAISMTYAPYLRSFSLAEAKAPLSPMRQNLFQETVRQFLRLYRSPLTIHWNAQALACGYLDKAAKLLHIPIPPEADEDGFFYYLSVHIMADRIEAPAHPSVLIECLALLHGISAVQRLYPSRQPPAPFWTEEEMKNVPLPVSEDSESFIAFCTTLLKGSFYLGRTRQHWENYQIRLARQSHKKMAEAAVRWLLSQWQNLTRWILKPEEAILTAIIAALEQAKASCFPLLRLPDQLSMPVTTVRTSSSGLFAGTLQEGAEKKLLGTTTIINDYLPYTVFYPCKEGYFKTEEHTLSGVFPSDEFFTDSKANAKTLGEISIHTGLVAQNIKGRWRFYLPTPFGTRPKILQGPPGIGLITLYFDPQAGFYCCAEDASGKPVRELKTITYAIEAPEAKQLNPLVYPVVNKKNYINIDSAQPLFSAALRSLINEMKGSDQENIELQLKFANRLVNLFKEHLHYLNKKRDRLPLARLQRDYKTVSPQNFPNCVLREGMGVCAEISQVLAQLFLELFPFPVRLVGCYVIEESKLYRTAHRFAQMYIPKQGWVHFDPPCREKIPDAKLLTSSPNIVVFSSKKPKSIEDEAKNICDFRDYNVGNPLILTNWREFTRRVDRILLGLSVQQLGFSRVQEQNCPPGIFNEVTGCFETRKGLGNECRPQTLLLALDSPQERHPNDQYFWGEVLRQKFVVFVCVKKDIFIEAMDAAHIAGLLIHSQPPSAAALEKWQQAQSQQGRSVRILKAEAYQHLTQKLQAIYRSLETPQRISQWAKEASLTHSVKEVKHDSKRAVESKAVIKPAIIEKSGEDKRADWPEVIIEHEELYEDRNFCTAKIGDRNKPPLKISQICLDQDTEKLIHQLILENILLLQPITIQIPQITLEISHIKISQDFLNYLINPCTKVSRLYFTYCDFGDSSLLFPDNKNIIGIRMYQCTGVIPYFAQKNILSLEIVYHNFYETVSAKKSIENINLFLKNSLHCFNLIIGALYTKGLARPLFNELVVPPDSHLLKLSIHSCDFNCIRIHNGFAKIDNYFRAIELIDYSGLVFLTPDNIPIDQQIKSLMFSARSPEEMALLQLNNKKTTFEIDVDRVAALQALSDYMRAILKEIEADLMIFSQDINVSLRIDTHSDFFSPILEIFKNLQTDIQTSLQSLLAAIRVKK